MSNWRINWDRQPLGKVPDSELATLLECSKQAVHQARKTRGIPAFSEDKFHRCTEIDWDTIPLGKISDYQLANIYGVAPKTIKRAREARGL